MLDPGLYRYLTPDAVLGAARAMDDALGSSTSLAEAYLAIARYTAALRCGHCYPNFFNQPAVLGAALFDGRNRLPFAFRWLGRHLIVTANLAGTTDPAPGDEVLAIDGRAAGEILDRLLPLVRSDGANDAKRLDELSVSGRARYEAFDVFFPLAFPSTSARFTLQVRAPGAAAPHAVTVDAQTESDRAALAAARPSRWTLRRLDARAALLAMPTWNTYDASWDWKAFVQGAFAQLAADGTPNLIVDLRGNEGGTTAVGYALAAYLIGAPARLDPVHRLVRYRRVPDDLAPYLDTYDPTFKDWGVAATPFDERFFSLAPSGDAPPLGEIAPLAPRYRGRVWVLVDGSNSSATFLFDAFAQQRHLATLVGTPTGGNQRGIDGGAFFFLRLPNSGIEVDLPLIGTFPLAAAPDAGLRPDLAVEPTPADVATGRDAALDAVLARIRR